MTDHIQDDRQLIDARFKDSSPEATVRRIRQILAENGIKTEEYWRQTCVPYCYSLAVRIKGTGFSVNGKGLTKSFALASGYGELMERLQFANINTGHAQKLSDLTANDPSQCRMDLQTLLSTDRGWYEKISRRLEKYTGSVMTAEAILKRNADPDGTVPCSPVYCLTTGEQRYYPNALRGRIYTTNGLAAGNSAEETLVQAISEIVERHHMLRIIHEGLILPDIPEEALVKHRTAYDIITYIRQQGLRVSVKDCSFGTGFPVICVCMTDPETGRYHTHLGAYPIFEIALERALTESFQGYDIHHVARFEEFLPQNRRSFTSVSNEVTQGSWAKPRGFFTGTPSFPYDPEAGFSGEDNKALLRQIIRWFQNRDLDILVRDYSCLGFHTYQVIIPGYSECFLNRIDPRTDDLRYASFAEKTLQDPSKATLQDMLGLLMHQQELKNLTANINGVHGFLSQARISADLTPAQEARLLNGSLGYVYHAIGKLSEAAACAENLIQLCSASERGKLVCLKRYLSWKQEKVPEDEIWRSLRLFHHDETVDDLRSHVLSGQNPFAPYILHCDMDDCDSCPIRKQCRRAAVGALSELILTKRTQMDFQKFCEELEALR